MFARWVLWLASIAWVGSGSATGLPNADAPMRIAVAEFPANFSYAAYQTKDLLDRNIQFYLTHADARDDRPLVVVLQGSGCASHFALRDGRVGGGWHSFVRQAAANNAQVLLVEKPGVKTFDQPDKPGSAENCSGEFRREQNGERWLAAIQAALSAAIKLRGVTPTVIVAIGHSEGGVYAPRLAIADSRVTHVASLAAVPTSQLSDFVHMALNGTGFVSQAPGNRADHLMRVLTAWQAVSAEPDSAEKMVFGHAHRYWADKFAPFDFAALSRTRAKFLIAYGSHDENSSPTAMDQFVVELITRKRDVTWLRVEGGTHAFGTTTETDSYATFAEIAKNAVEWALGRRVESKHKLWPLG